MEEGLYEVDVKTLAVTELWADEQRKPGRHADLPGYHGKGFYSAQGRYVYANNGDHAAAALTDPDRALAACSPSGTARRTSGPSCGATSSPRSPARAASTGNPPGDDRLWSIGWDHRSLILMLLDGGKWHSFRLPKATHSYDGAHGWNTEWPRIRDIGEDALLMTMHGTFWSFPKTFSRRELRRHRAALDLSQGHRRLLPLERPLVFGCDDTARSEFLNKRPHQGQARRARQVAVEPVVCRPARLDACGPALGRGAVWLEDDVKAGTPSEPFLFSGFAKRSLHLAHDSAEPVTFTIEVDAQRRRHVDETARDHRARARQRVDGISPQPKPAPGCASNASRDAAKATAFFHYRAEDPRADARRCHFRRHRQPRPTRR